MIAVLKAGSVVAGRYRLEQKLGQGGMGVVWRATQLALGRPVALKFILIGNDDARFREMFAQEAQIASQLNHQNIVPVVEFGEESDIPFLVTVYVMGTDLGRLLLKAPNGLPVPVVFYVALQVLYALQHAHENHVIHRDLKPGNVLISQAGGVLLTDFGIAKLVDPRRTPSISTIVKGSPGFMAPEVLRGLAAGFPADLFALGGLVWECITGRNPFHDESNERERIFYNTLNLELPPISSIVLVPAGLDSFLARALAKDPGQRHQSAQEAIDELLAISAPFTHEATTPGELRKLLRASLVETQVEVPWQPRGLTPGLSGSPVPPLVSGPTLRTSGMAGQVLANGEPASTKTSNRRRPRKVAATVAVSVAALVVGAVWIGSSRSPQVVTPATSPSPGRSPLVTDAMPLPSAAVMPKPRLGRLTISVTPTDARVSVDEHQLDGGPPYVVTIAVESTARVRVERDGYVAQTLNVQVEEDTRRSVELDAAPGANESAQPPQREDRTQPVRAKHRKDTKQEPAKLPASTKKKEEETVDKEGTFKKL
jgi:serine/threonine protein kinase